MRGKTSRRLPLFSSPPTFGLFTTTPPHPYHLSRALSHDVKTLTFASQVHARGFSDSVAGLLPTWAANRLAKLAVDDDIVFAAFSSSPLLHPLASSRRAYFHSRVLTSEGRIWTWIGGIQDKPKHNYVQRQLVPKEVAELCESDIARERKDKLRRHVVRQHGQGDTGWLGGVELDAGLV